ncbi:hypothetical protein GCM10022224_044330 [Nonomuraea antimicrobica]|uniref:Uncharacterized protein n=1 Tax=Nonomuraea antimicrobica TaxID=561173 RepID=A0ABP7C3I6_9ACTN
MSDKLGRRPGAGRRVALAAAAGALTLTTVTGLAGSASGDTYGPSPVGTWAAVVTLPSTGQSERVLFAFRADGSLTVNDGRRTGLGSWRPTATGFKYHFRHYTVNAQGALEWELRNVTEGQVTSADVFTATGTGTAVDPNGNVLGSFPNNVEAKRYSLQAP